MNDVIIVGSEAQRNASEAAVRLERVVRTRRTPMAVAIVGAALASVSMSNTDHIAKMFPMPKWKPGKPLDSHDGKPFTDSKGRVYTRDAKGTIRRVS
jgi:hypothetical protein